MRRMLSLQNMPVVCSLGLLTRILVMKPDAVREVFGISFRRGIIG